MKTHSIIYIPGLGDHSLKGRSKLLKPWSRYKDIEIELCPMHWTVNEPWEEKLSWLINKIDHRHGEGKLVTIIGESAGATAVINALWLRSDKLHAAVLLCGKSQYPDRVSPHLYRRNPAFREALTDSHKIIQNLTHKQKDLLLNWHPILDLTVPVAETKIPGVKNKLFPALLHAISIVSAMTIWNWQVVHHIRKRAKQGGK